MVGQLYFRVFGPGNGKAETAVFPCEDKDVAKAGVKGGAAFRICLVGYYAEEFGIIVDAETDVCVFDRSTVHGYRDAGPSGGDIAADNVDFRIAGGLLDYVFRAVVVSVNLGMEYHGAGHGAVEPAHVKGGFGLAGAHEVPAVSGKDLNPGVVVVRVGPAGGVHLPCRDSGRPERRYGENGLFSASAETPEDGGFRGACAGVRRGVGGLLVAPVVDLKGCLRNGHAFHA